MIGLDSFRQKLLDTLTREELLEIISEQNPKLITGIERIEYVFKYKLRHLKWESGPHAGEYIDGRPLTNYELTLLIDEPFKIRRELTTAGLDEEQQRKIHIAKDPVTWARAVLKDIDGSPIQPRVYQILVLRNPSIRKVLRQGRRSGKSYSLALFLLHWAYIHTNAKCLIITPQKEQGGLIYKSILEFVQCSPLIADSIVRNVTSPQYRIELSNGSEIKFFSSGVNCLTDDHEVLTRDGWKSIAKVEIGEEVLSWDDGQSIWVQADNKMEFDYQGPLLENKSKALSFRATPEHKWPTRNWRGKFTITKATDLKQHQVVPGSGTSPPYSSEVYSGDELELWGWWLSEGSGSSTYCSSFSQKKQFRYDRIIELATNLGYKTKIYQYGDKAAEIRVLGWQPPIFSGTNCYDKFIPRPLLGEKNKSRLLLGLLGGDGYYRRNGWEYSSSSLELINGVQELAVLEGWRTLLKEKKINYKPVDGGLPNKHWRVSAYPRDGWHIAREQDRQWIDYEGKVYCLSVPGTHTFYVRHNGCVHVTSNSGGKANIVRGQEADVLVLDELDYMHPDDITALYAMLQTTREGQEEKVLIAASTPTGQRTTPFWEFAHNPRFIEFWYPSMCNPFWTQETEAEMKAEYTANDYAHEFEADWGEDVQGVYPRRYLDRQFLQAPEDWDYKKAIPSGSKDSFYVMGVDWDKYGAGTNFVILEVCGSRYEDSRFRNKIKCIFREETPKEEYTYLNAVARIIELHKVFNFKHIYADAGAGETQIEMLHRHGMEHPETKLRKIVKRVGFGEAIELTDPETFQKDKKPIKPFMVDNLHNFLEKEYIYFSARDEELYIQLASYAVKHVTEAGRPVFEPGGNAVDHAHDALILACLAITQNYGDLMKLNLARYGTIIQGNIFTALIDGDPNEQKSSSRVALNEEHGPILVRRAMSATKGRTTNKSSVSRRSF